MRCIVVDVGGTTLRTACWDADVQALSGVRRVPVRGTGGLDTEDVVGVQRSVVEQLVEEIELVRGSAEGFGAVAVGVAFAGPVTGAGTVTGAPTVWGGGGPALPLAELLRERTGMPVTVVNDTTAAAWRYADPGGPAFCLFTVSSGISNKIYVGDDVLVDAGGHGGELGHLLCDPAPDAPRCDCGGRGHLGALASGRGMLAAARRAARAEPGAFAVSRLAELCAGTATPPQPDDITNRQLARAAHEGDPFAVAVVRTGLAHLATAVSSVFLAAGIRRYVFVGGFALAVGERFLDVLAEELLRVGCFGLTAPEIRDMLVLGAPDDDHCLIGMGRLLGKRHQASEAPLLTK
ncbi:ROK family protein [Streptomyces sp. NBC_01373]|uniref:ROK family protein n=1 Tax=unclassified Streptomyces TaxID=2593676 RepID=UPI00225875EB|nr:ROK family protein [Streptomyces sp. NBC_01373]MCX4698832.1 ROK family protein [Streptomyces sp. NBC_01373]